MLNRAIRYAEVMIAASAMLAFAAGCGGSPKSSSTSTASDTPTSPTTTNNNNSPSQPGGNSNTTNGQTITVSGVVLDEDGNPVTAEAVLVPGLTPTATDDAGKFSIGGVTTPYDLVVIKGNTKTAFIYKGLTRPDPTVFMWTQEDDQTRLADRSAILKGAVDGGLVGPAFINFASHELNQWYDPDSDTGIMDAGIWASGTYEDHLEWNGPITTVGNVLGLQYTPDLLSGLPLLYYYDYQPGVTVLAGQPNAIAGPHLHLRPTATDTVQGTVTTPGQYSVTNKFVGLQFAGGINFFVFDEKHSYNPGAAAERQFNYIVPDLAGATTQVCAKAKDNLFSGALSVTCNTVQNQDGVLPIVIREAPEPFVPANYGKGCGFKTLFQWTPIDGGIYVVKFAPDVRLDSVGNISPKFVIITADEQVSIPDLRSVGLGLMTGADYSWVVRGMGPFASVDEFSTYPVAVPPFDMCPVGSTGNLTAPVPEAFFTKSQKYHFSTCSDDCFN